MKEWLYSYLAGMAMLATGAWNYTASSLKLAMMCFVLGFVFFIVSMIFAINLLIRSIK
jgi:hypothetical protein